MLGQVLDDLAAVWDVNAIDLAEDVKGWRRHREYPQCEGITLRGTRCSQTGVPYCTQHARVFENRAIDWLSSRASLTDLIATLDYVLDGAERKRQGDQLKQHVAERLHLSQEHNVREALEKVWAE